ncbi:MAG: hypothetical protein PHH75_05170 [Candidatus Omnitrophica bacterium]|nr:hypothetical protein [Candidatus Omnitrophota bacterium]MDD5574554.1 hypothetical protein [Candidatus Omnitrophota bacterium]
MPNHSFDPVLQEGQEFQNALFEAYGGAARYVQESHVPSWVDTWGQFIRQHPWGSLIAALVIIFLVTAVIRELICGYLKTNEILARLRRLEEKIK